jgi:hypothetical protein
VPRLDLVEVLRRVHERELFASGRRGSHEIRFGHDALGKEALARQAVLRRDEDVRADVHLVGRIPHEERSGHGPLTAAERG